MKKLGKLLCCGALACMMAGALMSPVYAAADGDGSIGGPSEEIQREKASLENLSLYAQNYSTYEITAFDAFEVNQYYSIDYQDLVEGKFIGSTTEQYYHTTFENLSTDIVEISLGGELGFEPQNIVESKDSGSMMHTGIGLKGIKTGNAKIKATIYDISNPENTRTEIINITINEQTEKPTEPEEPKDEVSYVGSKDILASENVKQETLNRISNAEDSFTINLVMKQDLNTVSLPNDILQAAKNKNIPLTVNVNVNGKTTTWTFKNMDKTMDVNLAMNVLKTSDIASLKDKDGLVLAFQHQGVLPIGTTVKTYVGDKFKAGDKVQLSYFNEKTNALEETKYYTVDANGYVSVVINHCSNYVLEKATGITPVPNPDTKPEVKPTPDVNNNNGIKQESVNTGDTTHLFMFIGLLAISGFGMIVLNRKARKI